MQNVLAIYIKHSAAQKFKAVRITKTGRISRPRSVLNASLFKLEALQDVKGLAKKIQETVPHWDVQVRRITL